MKVNPYKCHFICSANNDTVNLIAEYQIIGKSKCKELLGEKFNYKFTFNAQIDDIWKKAGLKLNVLSRLAQYMYFNKKWLSMNTFFMSLCLNSIIVLWFGCVKITKK